MDTPYDKPVLFSARATESASADGGPSLFPVDWWQRRFLALPDMPDEAFVETALQNGPANSLMVCTRAGSHVFQENATLSSRNHVEVRVCVDMIKTVKAILTEAASDASADHGPIFVHGDVLCSYVDGVARSVLQTTRTLGGYDPDFGILSDVTEALLLKDMRQLATLGGPPVVLQSGQAVLPPRVLSDMDHVQSPRVENGSAFTGVHAGAGAGWQPRIFIGWTQDTIEPDLERVRQHATFLIETDDVTLRSMHGPALKPDYAQVVAVWRSNLQALQDYEGAGSSGAAAIQKLDALTAHSH
ncbi:MAG: hypothetical protein AAFV45_14425 [Pseudomonadota bacterium]